VILVDTSVWADHLRRSDPTMTALLEAGDILVHAFIIGELALGNLPKRDEVIEDLTDLPHIGAATDEEVLHLIEVHRLYGTGIGYVDAHLLAAVRISPGTSLWTRDRRLAAVAERLSPPHIAIVTHRCLEA
jgi:predicted nucleic acid-binding protein